MGIGGGGPSLAPRYRLRRRSGGERMSAARVVVRYFVKLNVAVWLVPSASSSNN